MTRSGRFVLASALLGGLGMSVAVSGWAETLPKRGLVDARVRTAVYNTEEIYRLYGHAGYQIELEFELGESFVGLGAGDIEGLSFVAQGNHLFIKPKATMIGTNLTVLTDRRHYRFDYSVSLRPPSAYAGEVIYALRFTYPPERLAGDGLTPEERIAVELAKSKETRQRNFDYWFCGSRSVKPIAASDNGVHTRIRFPDRLELPALFVRNDDGSESLLNFSMDEGDVVVHRIAPRFIIRRGRLTGCIVNKGFSGSGERLESGTIAPQVIRDVKEPVR